MSHGSVALRRAVCEANLALVDHGLVMATFGNVSGVDRAAGLFLIKPSGVPYDRLTPDSLVPVSLESGEVLEGDLRPSSDTPTHLELYRAFDCGGIAHSHAIHATAFAQACQPIPCMGTTHADHFRGDVPVTRAMTQAEVDGRYEHETGRVIVEAFRSGDISPADVPGVLVAHHGPFTWGPDAAEAVENAAILEYLARIEIARLSIAADAARPAALPGRAALHPQARHRRLLRTGGSQLMTLLDWLVVAGYFALLAASPPG